MTDKQSDPPYTEEQATRWLAWLAYNMRRRDMTIFQIESLQPDWLMGHLETIPHLLLTRILWGIWVGLNIGLIGWLLGERLVNILVGSIDMLIAGLIVGLLVGLTIGLTESITPLHNLDAFLRNQNRPTLSLVFGTFLGGLIFGIIGGLWSGLFIALIFGLIVGPIFGFIRTYRVLLREVDHYIHTFESISWSWQATYTNAKMGGIFGLISGLIGGMAFGFLGGVNRGLIGGLIGALIFGIIVGLIGGIVGGFQPGAEELKSRPNQGIWLTVRSALKIGLTSGLIIGTIAWLLSQNIAVGFAYGILVFSIIGGWYGGLDAVEHGIVRRILAWRGHAPLNYAHFLDYAAQELNFLQTVGGGYIFIHRYLLEHFAEIAVEKGYVSEKFKLL